MKYEWSKTSRENLSQCHVDLQRVFNLVLEVRDCSVICGERKRFEQNELFKKGRTQLKFPDSKHNNTPSLAADVVPYPVDWEDSKEFIRFAHFVLGVGHGLAVPLRWGGDWDRDFDLEDQRFNDYPHFELVRTRRMSS